MEHQKIINLLDDTTNQPSKFRTMNWVETNDELKGKYDKRNRRFKTSMMRPDLCGCSDAYILVQGIINVPDTAAGNAAVSNTNKNVIFGNCAPFTICITEINKVQVDDAQDIGIVMSMYTLIEYSDAYSQTSGSLWQYYRDEPALEINNNIIDFHNGNINSTLFTSKQQITGETGNGGTKVVDIIVPLKYLSKFWKTLEMPLINCKISLQLKWSKNCILVAGTAANQKPYFEIIDTKIYVPVVTLSTQGNVKLLKQL